LLGGPATQPTRLRRFRRDRRRTRNASTGRPCHRQRCPLMSEFYRSPDVYPYSAFRVRLMEEDTHRRPRGRYRDSPLLQLSGVDSTDGVGARDRVTTSAPWT